MKTLDIAIPIPFGLSPGDTILVVACLLKEKAKKAGFSLQSPKTQATLTGFFPNRRKVWYRLSR